MSEQELSYKAEAEHWKAKYLRLLDEVRQMRGYQREKRKYRYLCRNDEARLAALQRSVDKKVEQASEELKLMQSQPQLFQ